MRGEWGGMGENLRGKCIGRAVWVVDGVLWRGVCIYIYIYVYIIVLVIVTVTHVVLVTVLVIVIVIVIVNWCCPLPWRQWTLHHFFMAFSASLVSASLVNFLYESWLLLLLIIIVIIIMIILVVVVVVVVVVLLLLLLPILLLILLIVTLLNTATSLIHTHIGRTPEACRCRRSSESLGLGRSNTTVSFQNIMFVFAA